MSSAFDRIIAVDGSAASTPKTGTDSIWIAVDDGGVVSDPENPPTRASAMDRLARRCSEPGRTLVAVDWSLGYPAGSAAVFGLGSGRSPWLDMWSYLTEHISDGERNDNDRFLIASALNARTEWSGPFWGAPASAVTADLTSTKPPFRDVAEWRAAEALLRSRRRWPKSCWQLGGAGSVGSQSLLGIPRLAQLRDRLSEVDVPSAVWPFETGLAPAAADTRVVIAEMWPSLFVGPADLPPHWIRDAAQVDASVRQLRDAERTGRLDAWFAPVVDDPAAVTGEEGWILGLV